MRTLLLIIGIFGWVGSVQAAVLINEVAWMGTDESYLCEWIELYNTGTESVSLENWTIQLGDGPLKAFVDGEFTSLSISPNSYFVVERLVASCPDPVPETNDMLLAFGSISNTNTTLRLFRDLEGTQLADQLASGEDWSAVGGSNETKDTAQYSESGWQTAAATPGSATVVGSAPTVASDTESTVGAEGNTASSKTNSTASKATTLSLQEQSRQRDPLTVTIEYPTTVYANQTVTFTAEARGRGQTVRNSLHYDWNFGDLATAKGATAEHTYMFPGEYVVSLQADYAEYEARETRTVVVLPVTLRMNITKDGHLNIHNTAQYAVDVSGYTLSTVPPVTFPARSMMVPRGTITVPNDKLGTHAAAITLYDQQGNVVSETEDMVNTASAASSQSAVLPPSAPVASEPPAATVASSVASEDSVPPVSSDSAMAMVSGARVAESQNTNRDTAPVTATSLAWLWYALLVGLVGVGVFTIFFTGSPGPLQASEALADDD